jgi:hypothetical protein
MSRFLTPLRAEKSGQYWTILQPLIFDSDVAQKVFIVPAGFVTDFASVPRLPLAFLLTGDSAHEAAVVHDFLYSRGLVTREMADAVFREAAKVSGEPGWKSWLLFLGVRLGGWVAWNDHRSVEKIKGAAK